MKVVPLIVLAVLVILPFAIRFFYTIVRSSTKDSDAIAQPPPTTEPKPEQFFRWRPWLAYIAVALYFLLLIAAVFWVIRSFASAFGLPPTGTTYVVVFTFIIFIGLAAGLFLWFRYVRKKISLPNKETAPEARLEWENKHADLFYKNMLRMSLLLIGFVLVISALIAITAYFFA